MATKNISGLFNQNKIAVRLQSKYRKIIDAFFDDNYSDHAYSEAAEHTGMLSRMPTLQLQNNSFATNGLAKMLQEIKVAK